VNRPATGSSDRWISDEWRLVRAARRALARAWRRPRRVLAVALLLSGAFVTLRALQPPRYEASLYLRLAEGDLTDPNAAPRPPRDVRQHLANIALSRHQLKQVMANHGRAIAWLARDPVAAVDDFRDEISIEVSRNYFLFDRGGRDEPRSAQVTVTLSGSDAEQTEALLHDIGQVILAGQLAQRSGRLVRARDLLAVELAAARGRSRTVQEALERLAAKAIKAEGRDLAALESSIAVQETEARSAIDQVLLLERRLASVDFSGAVEAEHLGLNLQLVDERLVAIAPPLTPSELALLGLGAFLVALLLVAPVVGAFDDRLYDAEDLVEHGLELVGAFPRFPGDEAGAGRSRGLPPDLKDGRT
jgi:hypothetical protein